MSGSVATDDLYRVLQVEPHADAEAIQAAYRRLARLYHPDLNKQPGAAERMSAINAAYRVLSDPVRRAAYDARRYLPRVQPVRATTSYRSTAAPPPKIGYAPPTHLQRQVDRVVAVVGVILLLLIGFYIVNVFPYIEEQQALDRRPAPLARSAAATSTEHPGGIPVPQRIANDDRLRGFPGTVLVAPESLPPFSSLPVVQIDATGQGIARYAVYYGDWSRGGATITGLRGNSFSANVPTLPGCAAEATYCVGPAPGQTSGGNGMELFREPDLMADNPAVGVHRVCCNGTFWTIAWYEPRANTSYAVDLSRSLALQFGSHDLGQQNLAAARAIASIGKQLVRLP